jgi:hypothetical protein
MADRTRYTANLVSHSNLYADITTDRVGVGTTNPQFDLDVSGDINFTGTFYQNGSQFVASRWTSGTGDDIYRLNGNVGVGTTNPTSKLTVEGDVNITGVITASSFSGNASTATYASTAGISTYSETAGIATYATLSGISTYSETSGISTNATYATTSGIATDLTSTSSVNTTGIITATSFSGSGVDLTNLNASNLSTGIVPAARITETSTLNVGGDLYVSGNISFGGTTTQLNTSQLTFSDPDLVLGVGTTSTFNPTDNTANHGGIAIASTEGSPLVDLNITPAEVLPTTYKKIMWFKNNTAGLGTDAWLSNYAVGIGSTQFPTGTRLAAGNIQFTEDDLTVVRNINASGVVTATAFVGDGSGLTNLPSSGSSSQWVTTAAGIHTLSNVGIGTTNPTEKLHVVGNILASGTVTANSDEKLKKNIKTIPNALDKVIQLRGVEFDRKDFKEHQIGVIAQEVEQVIPEVVYGVETKSVAYGNLVGLLIEAIKEQQDQINELKELLNQVIELNDK